MARHGGNRSNGERHKTTISNGSGDSSAEIKLKIEINTRERQAFDPPQAIPYAVDNPWCAGRSNISTFSREELLATKLSRTLAATERSGPARSFPGFRSLGGLECGAHRRMPRTLSRARRRQPCSGRTTNVRKIGRSKIHSCISAASIPAQAAKLTNETIKHAFSVVFTRLIKAMPGEPWAKTQKRKRIWDRRLAGERSVALFTRQLQ